MKALIFAVFLPVVALAEAPAAGRSSFGPGEQTTYEVSYLGVPTGTAQITVGWQMEQYGAQVWPIVCVGQTTSVASVYQLKDRFITYWNPKSGRSVGAEYLIDENRKRRRERYRYDEQQLKTFATKQHEGKAAVEVTYEMPFGTVDLAAASFKLRNTALRVGESYELPIFTGIKNYLMHATVEAKQTIDTKLGPTEVFRVSVNGDFSGNVATKRNLLVYFTADERALPIRAEAEFAVGTVVAEAVRYEPGRTVTGDAL